MFYRVLRMNELSREDLHDRFFDEHDVRYEIRLVIDGEPIRTLSDNDIEVVQAYNAENQLDIALDEYIKDYFEAE